MVVPLGTVVVETWVNVVVKVTVLVLPLSGGARVGFT